MSDIDFLANNKLADDKESKDQNNRKEKIAWTKPDENKPLVKEAPFSLLSFFGGKKPVKKPTVEKPSIDKNKIRDSRREILKLIKHNESSAVKEKIQPGKGWLAGLMEKLKKQPDHKEALISYHQIFSQEKNKRSLPVSPPPPLADKLSAAKFSSPVSPGASPRSVFDQSKRGGEAVRQAEIPVKPIISPLVVKQLSNEALLAMDNRALWADQNKKTFKAEALVEKKPLAAKPEKAVKSSFLSRFLKMIKDSLANLSQPRIKPAKVISAEALKKTEAPIIQPPPVKPVQEEKTEVKKKPLEKKEPPQIKFKQAKVLETNLIKGEIITFFDWRRKIITLINAILIPIFLLVIIHFGLIFYQGQNQKKLQEQAKSLNDLTEETKQEEVGLKEILDFQARLKIVSQIFAKHIYWTNFFKFLEDNTIKDVYYAGFSGATGGSYSLEAVASDFSNISEQINILRDNEKITEARTLGGEFMTDDSADGNKVKFTLDFTISKDIFIE
ncbi:MAG: hypothetical protein Q7K35_00185 [bacterium]|nr:hypothetical protein [bacterium]